ncbi:MAG: alpha/beta hydrolase [Pseudomonadales bacterium]|jgi:acetyl esterase/lipase|nr:alpha/beta hydrolase [Pseudomonadales bacterium]HJN51675.1 alpha/beta hydrolase [Pseudomonadales bacterium]
MNDTAVLQDGELLLWPSGPVQADGDELTDIPALTVHLPPAGQHTGTGIIINPGGGYRILASDHEGLQVARWLNRQGIAAFVLRYRLGPKYHSDVSLLDGQRAMRLVRSRATEFGLSPERIGMLGFSAGGHLTVAVGTRYDGGDAGATDAVERVSSQPDFLVPVYAVTNGKKRGRKADEYTPADDRVSAETPPAFLVHTHEDGVVPSDQSILFYQALHKHGVNAEMHVFGYGEHGIGLAAGDPDVAAWQTLLMNWLRRGGFLTDGARIAVRGKATLDGTVMGMFWVTLVPINANAPIARTKTDRSGDGQFEIDAGHGPVAGRHRIEVRHISDQYPHVATGVYTIDDAACYALEADVTEGGFLQLQLDSRTHQV